MKGEGRVWLREGCGEARESSVALFHGGRPFEPWINYNWRLAFIVRDGDKRTSTGRPLLRLRIESWSSLGRMRSANTGAQT